MTSKDIELAMKEDNDDNAQIYENDNNVQTNEMKELEKQSKKHEKTRKRLAALEDWKWDQVIDLDTSVEHDNTQVDAENDDEEDDTAKFK
ncbi:hypothetical protein R6Q59_011106 [Mikania micrantha]|uniref:Uncharacterized protein n=1 Tax=Mikania micrantha TaxID=192012 RepID=A0A5N6NX78_9ASTR|nr:hypothetical protein E3N88_15106 [Mikania micrantha]